jgi:hypothetical protein
MRIKNLKPYSVLRSKYTGGVAYVSHLSYFDEYVILCRDIDLKHYLGTISFEQAENDFFTDIEYKVQEMFKV